MKYIKYFEKKISKTQEILDYSKNSLAYLIDDGFSIDVKLSTNPTITYNSYFEANVRFTRSKDFDTIIIDKKYLNRESRMFNFEDILDDLIPFILMLNDKYVVKHIIYTYGTKGAKYILNSGSKNLEISSSYLEENLVHPPNLTYNKIISSILIVINK